MPIPRRMPRPGRPLGRRTGAPRERGIPRPWLVRVRGVSMMPTFVDGDLLLALRGARPRPGTAVVRLPPDAAGRARPVSVKRIAPAPGSAGRWWVDSDDPRGVTSGTVGTIADEDVLGRILVRLYRRRRRTPGRPARRHL